MGFRQHIFIGASLLIFACDAAKPAIEQGLSTDLEDSGLDEDTDDCTPREEVCDGVDNDCDGDVDSDPLFEMWAGP